MARFDKKTWLPPMEAAGFLDEAELVRSLTDEERGDWERAEQCLEKLVAAARGDALTPEERGLLAWAAEQREHWLDRQYVRFRTGKNSPEPEDWMRVLFPEEFEEPDR